MAGHGDGHGQESHGGHGGITISQWMDEHVSGIVMPFGEKVEQFFEGSMFLIVNGFFRRAAVLCLLITTPVLLIEFVLRAV